MDLSQVLKSDVFGRIRRAGNVVVRETEYARPWARMLARHLMRREYRALSRLALVPGLTGIPRVARLESTRLTREWIDGEPMQIARPRTLAYFRQASRLLRQLHAANVIHNDLAKETNWLVTPDGRPALVDFQLAMTLDRRGPLGRRLRDVGTRSRAGGGHQQDGQHGRGLWARAAVPTTRTSRLPRIPRARTLVKTEDVAGVARAAHPVLRTVSARLPQRRRR